METKIKIAVISHSNVHPRQQIFFKDLAKQQSTDIVLLGPRWWNNQIMNDVTLENYKQRGLPCSNKGMMQLYMLLAEEDKLKDFKPQIIYSQTELWTKQAERSLILANKFKSKLIYFVWENLRPLTPREKKIAEYASLIICGNKEAEKLLHDVGYMKTIILPQVGISKNLFKQMSDIKKETDVLYVGRQVPEKGIDFISKACQKLKFTFNITSSKEYADMPKIYNKTKIFCSFPIDTSIWKEQSGSYTNIEATACKIPVVTSNAGAIPEYMGSNVRICPQKNLEELTKALSEAMNASETTKDLVDKAYSNFLENFSTDVVAKKLFNTFKHLLDIRDFI